MNHLARIAALIFIALQAMAATPPQSIDLDLSQTARAFRLQFAEGTTPLLRGNVKNAGSAYTVTGWTATLYLSATWDDTSVIAIPSTTTGATYFDFQMTGTHTSTNGVFTANIIATDGSSTVEWQRGQVEIRPSPGTAGAGTITLSTPLSWSGYTYSNTGGGGPYRAGTNVVFTVNSDGSANINADVTGGSGDITGITGSGGIVVVTNGNGPIPDINVSTNAVRAAIADDYISRFGDVIDGGDLEMGNAAGHSFSLKFRDAVSALHTLRVTAAGVLEFDDLPVLNTGSSINAATLGGESGEYYRNWSNVTNTTGVIGATQLASTAVSAASYVFGNGGFTVDADGRLTAANSGTGNLITDADKGDVTVSGTGGAFTIDAGAVTGSKAGAGVDRSTRINVKDYGATGDGSDQTAAIQNAMTAAAASTGKVFFPAGTYKLTSGVTLANVSNAEITGEQSTVLIDIDTHATYAVTLTNCTTVAVSGMRFDFNANAYTNTAIKVRNVTKGARVSDCDFFNYGKEQSTGVEFYRVGATAGTSAGMDGPGAVVSACNFSTNAEQAGFDYNSNIIRGTGLRFLDYAEYWTVTGCNFYGINCGVYIKGGANGRVENCSFTLIDGTFTSGTGFGAAGIFEDAGSAVNGGKHTIIGNKFAHNWRVSIQLTFSDAEKGSVISGNSFIANALDPIWIINASRFLISGNYFDRCYNFGSFTNHPTSSARRFISASGCASGLVVGNTFINSNGWCVHSAASDNLVVMDNIYKTVTTAFSILSGAGNVESDNHNK